MKNVVITGVSSGIGRETARHLSAQGWRVFGSVRSQADADSASAEIGGAFVPIVMDVTDEATVRRAATEVGEALGKERLQGLVNNAGIETLDAIAVQPIEDVRATLDVHVLGMVRCVQAFLPLLATDEAREGPKGRIVNMSSIAGSVGYPYFAAYAAAKHAVNGMSEAMRREFRAIGVKVVVIAPGNTKSGVFEKVAVETDPRATASTKPHLEGTIWQQKLADFRALFLDGAKNGWPMATIAKAVEKGLTARNPRGRTVVSAERVLNYTAPLLGPTHLVDAIFDFRVKQRAKKPALTGVPPQ